MRIFIACLLFSTAALAQDAPNPGRGSNANATPVNAAYIRENYSKFEYRIPMRDGVKLFASVYIPKDVFSDGRTYPIIMQRTPYNVRPYGPD